MNHINTTGLPIIIIGIVLSLIFGGFAQKYRDSVACNAPNGNKKAVIYMAISYLAMWLPSAFRYNVGIDNDNYQMQFYATSKLSDAFSYYEPGYGLLCYLCKAWFNDYQVLLFITAMLTGGLMWKAIYKYSNNIVLCIIGYIAVNMYFMSYTTIRQFIAIAILCNSIRYIHERKLFKFLVVWVLAVCFHYTSLIFVVLYFVYSKNEKLVSWKNYFILLMTAIFFFFTNINELIGSIFLPLSVLRDGYASYEETDTSKSINEIIFFLPVLFYTFVYRRQLKRNNRVNGVLFGVLILFIVTKFIGMQFPGLSRINYYFAFSVPILLSYSSKLRSIVPKVVLLLMILVYYAWSIINIFYYQWEDFLPYQSIFQR